MTFAERLQRDWWRAGLTPLTAALLPLAALYRLLAGGHRLAYRAGWLRAAQAPVPVIVIGNLVVGGAGKTPTVIALVDALRSAGWTPGVISRGYGRRSKDVMLVRRDTVPSVCGDEPLLIHLRSSAPVAVGQDRVAAARLLCSTCPEVDVLLADDGLQHHRLARQVQVLVFDDRGTGNAHALPAGPLREPLPRRVPATSLVLYNAAAPTTGLPGAVSQRGLAGVVPLDDWWQGRSPSLAALHALRGHVVDAAAGMAHPEKFFAMLEAEGLALRRWPLPDHDPFDRMPWPAEAQDVIVTEKDAVKLPVAPASGPRIWVATLDLQLPSDFMATLLQLLRQSKPSAPHHDA